MKCHPCLRIECCIAQIDLKVRSERVARGNISVTYTVQNTGTIDLCREIHICSKLLGKICLDSLNSVKSGSEIVVTKVYEVPEDYSGSSILESARVCARVDGDDWVMSKKIKRSIEYFRNIVMVSLENYNSQVIWIIYAHQLNADVVRKPRLRLENSYAIQYYAVPPIVTNNCALGTYRNFDDGFEVDLVDLPPGFIGAFGMNMDTIQRVPVNSGYAQTVFGKLGFVSDETYISGNWFVANGSLQTMFI